jgi:hypothetical protein
MHYTTRSSQINFSSLHALHDPLISNKFLVTSYITRPAHLKLLGLMNPISTGSRVKASHNISSAALRIVEGDEKGTGYQTVQLGHPVIGGDKYRDLVLQVECWRHG